MMSSLKPKFINICHFTSHCFSNLCYSNNNIGWLVLSKQKCQQRHDEASYIKLSCQKLSNGNYDLFIYLFKCRLWVYLKKHLRYYGVWKSFYKQYSMWFSWIFVKSQNGISKFVKNIMKYYAHNSLTGILWISHCVRSLTKQTSIMCFQISYHYWLICTCPQGITCIYMLS